MRVSNSLDPDQAQNCWGLIWVQIVCKVYQQTTLVNKEKKVGLVFGNVNYNRASSKLAIAHLESCHRKTSGSDFKDLPNKIQCNK